MRLAGIKHLVGKWEGEYFYHGTKSSTHEILFVLKQNKLLVGKGSNNTGSQLTLKLEYDAKYNTLTGTWYEITSQSGEYKGMEFRGALQFILTNQNKAEGMRVGYNRDRTKVNAGVWLLSRLAS